MKAVLLLEDGTVFHGRGFGAEGFKCGEAVFNTSMTGYQEILTDPSYNEQIITMTYPLIGNYGINEGDIESRGIFASGFVVREYCDYPSNFQSQQTLGKYLKDNNIIGIDSIDTRALTRHIRDKGAMRAIIASGDEQLLSIDNLKNELAKYPGLEGRDIVKDISIKTAQPFGNHSQDKEFKVAAFDFGIKTNILRMLDAAGCNVTIFPADTNAQTILDGGFDGVFLSNGPGDPEPLTYAIVTIKELLGKIPVFGICLGHQLLSLAMGGSAYKLKFGHRGGNQPVQNLKTKKVEITSQNHGFCVNLEALDKNKVELTHVNLNDNTLEGIRCKNVPAFSVQYHPESSPGPHDSAYLFDEFTNMMNDFKKV